MAQALNKRIMDALKSNNVDLAFRMFDQLNIEAKKVFLQELSDILVANENKAILKPNCAALLKRKLKTDKSFDEFYEGWLPPTTSIDQHGKKVFDYFSLPTRVINFKIHDKPDEFFSLSLIHSPYTNPATTLESYKVKHTDIETFRKHNNEDNLEDSEMMGYGSILSDDILGV